MTFALEWLVRRSVADPSIPASPTTISPLPWYSTGRLPRVRATSQRCTGSPWGERRQSPAGGENTANNERIVRAVDVSLRADNGYGIGVTFSPPVFIDSNSHRHE